MVTSAFSSPCHMLPHTGDSGSMLLWLSLAVVSGGAAVSALVVSKRKNRC